MIGQRKKDERQKKTNKLRDRDGEFHPRFIVRCVDRLRHDTEHQSQAIPKLLQRQLTRTLLRRTSSQNYNIAEKENRY